jgi:hypothetical protein
MVTEMPCSATAEELRTDAGTKPSGMPQAPMSLREIAEAFVNDEDANVVGVIEEILRLRKRKDGINFCGAAALGISDSIIEFVEAQNEH